MSSNRKTMINVICSIMVLATNIVISFFLSPYIVKHIGVEANGFVTLASNFVTYAQLIVVALNSMAIRFITLAYVKKDYKKANEYYNSVFWGNLIIVAVLILPAIFFIFRMETMIDVPDDIVWDVKLLFSFIFFNFFLTTGFPNWDCGVYVTNRLDRQYIPQMGTALIRCVLLFVVLTIFTPHVWYVGMAASIMTIVNLAVNGYNTHKLTPELRVSLPPKKIICSKDSIVELVGSGIWNSISSVGAMLLSGLDLIICNLFIDSTAMGMLALTKILPHYLQMFSSSICSAFAPELMINYAGGNKELILKSIKRACKITAIILILPLSGIIVLSFDFFKLWVPTQDARLLAQLSIITCMGYSFTSGTQILYNVFSVVNKVKINSILMMLSGLISTIIVLILIKYTELGIYAVAGVSVVVCLIRNLIYTIPYAAKYLGYKKTEFYPMVFLCFVSTLVVTGTGYIIRHYLIEVHNWIEFGLCGIVIVLVGGIINILVFLNKLERKYLIEKLKKKILRKVI